MTSHSLRRLTALEEVKLLDGDQLAELLLVEGAQEQREGPLLRLARQIYRAQACTDDKETPGFKRCQWIAGEPSWNDDCKCSARAVEGAPWCGEHLARVHGRTERPAEHYIPASESGWALVLQEDWLAAERRAGRLDPDAARALDHLERLWREIRKSLQEASISYERVFRQKARREALLPLERVKEGDSAAAMKLWLPWARHWQARPAGNGNARNLPTAYRLVEELVMEGRDPAILEARHGLPAGGAKGLLEEALLDYARRLQFFLDK